MAPTRLDLIQRIAKAEGRTVDEVKASLRTGEAPPPLPSEPPPLLPDPEPTLSNADRVRLLEERNRELRAKIRENVAAKRQVVRSAVDPLATDQTDDPVDLYHAAGASRDAFKADMRRKSRERRKAEAADRRQKLLEHIESKNQ